MFYSTFLNLTLKSLIGATVGILATGIFNSAWGITLREAEQEGTYEVGDFTFSEITAGGSDDEGGDGVNQWLDGFTVTFSDGNDGLTPSVKLDGVLNITGTYFFTYLLTSTNTTLAFARIDQEVFCGVDCDGFTSTEIFTDGTKQTPIAGVDDSDFDDLVKGGSPKNPIYVDVEVSYNGGDEYEGFEQTIQAVPFESDVLPLLGATILFGGGMWWKRRRGAGQIDLTAPGSDQESGHE